MAASKLFFLHLKISNYFRGEYNSSCLYGYSGPFCGICIKRFYFNRGNGFSCNECGDNTSNLLSSLAILFAGLIFLFQFLL
jgi:hypothetical protein